MLEKLKYIVYEDKGGEEVLVFPSTNSHKDMAEAVKATKVLGAGFCKFNKTKTGMLELDCFGDSHSLNIKSRERDSLIVTAYYIGLNHEI